MNKSLLDPFILSQEYPDNLDGKHTWGQVAVFKFNPTGDYAAVGLLSGAILLIDVETWSTVLELQGHSACITSLDWSKDSVMLVSAARDMHVFLWDLYKHKRVHSQLVGTAIAQVSLGESGFVVNKVDGPPIYISIAGFNTSTLPIKKSVASQFLENGNLLVGESTGILTILRHNHDTNTVDTIFTQKVCSSSITEIHVKGSHCSIISKDRVIRNLKIDFEAPNFEITTKISDLVNRFQWYGLATTPSSEFILAVPMEHAHSIYMWEASTGSIEHIFECPEEVLTLDFHPKTAVLVATGVDTGTAFVWNRKYKQEWGALAPDFTELVVNEIYHEREDEFDIVNEIPDTFKKWPKDQAIEVIETDVPVLKPFFSQA